jgi:hypothetical protein
VDKEHPTSIPDLYPPLWSRFSTTILLRLSLSATELLWVYGILHSLADHVLWDGSLSLCANGSLSSISRPLASTCSEPNRLKLLNSILGLFFFLSAINL